MKWFKHMSDSLDDPFIVELMDRFGHLGYVAWFGLIEIISKESGNKVTGKLTINPAYLRRKLRTSRPKLRELFDFCQTFGKVSVTFSLEKWEFDFPKILEIKDNYTKDLQATGKKLSKHKEVEVEVEAEEEKEKPLQQVVDGNGDGRKLQGSWERHFGTNPTPAQDMRLAEYLRRGKTVEEIDSAIQIAAENKKERMDYIEGILFREERQAMEDEEVPF